jgi:hypothetical protein
MTVRGPAASAEARLAAGRLRSPCCGAVLARCGGPGSPGRAGALRQALTGVLPLADPLSRPLVAAGSAAGDCLAVLEAVTAGLRCRFPALAAVTAHEVAGHLTGGLWLAPALPVLRLNTTLLAVDAVSPP